MDSDLIQIVSKTLIVIFSQYNTKCTICVVVTTQELKEFKLSRDSYKNFKLSAISMYDLNYLRCTTKLFYIIQLF